MRVAIVSCVYPPEPIVSAKTSAGLAAMLTGAGDQVTVICPFPSRPAGVVHPGFRRRWRQREAAAGVRIVRCFSTVSRRSTMPSRLTENVSFGLSSAIALATMAKPDVVYLNTWPLFATAFCAVVARLRGIPFVLSVQDVYPESLRVQGRAGSGGVVTRMLRALDGWVARRAAAVMVLAERWATIYRESRRVDPERIHVVSNWVDEETVRPERESALAWRRGRGIGDGEFLLVYGGNVGVAAGVEELIEAVAPQPGVKLLVAGDGARAEACEELARRLAPGRVGFLRPWQEGETSLVLSSADLLVLPTRGSQSAVSVPSKLITYMLSGRPLLAIAEPDSETAAIVRRAGAGWVVAPDDRERLAQAMAEARSSRPGTLDAMGSAAREFAVVTFGCAAGARIAAIVRGAA